MLILGRFRGQKIVINGELTISIQGFREKPTGIEVQLGFDGSVEKYLVDREEIYNKKRSEND